MNERRRGPIRVLHLRDSPWLDGPGRTILETAACMDRGRIDYHIGALVADPSRPHPLVEEARRRGLPVHAMDDHTGSLRRLVDRAVALMDALETEILHTSEFRTNLVGRLCRRRRPALRLVSTAHGWIANDLRGKTKTFLDRVLLQGFDRVILVSHAMRRRLPAWWVPEARVRIMHNALPDQMRARGAEIPPREPPTAGEPVTLLAAGRLSPEKGLDVLLGALAELAGDHPNLRLIIAGTGPMEDRLRTMAVKLGVTDRAKFIGYITDMSELYHAADLVVQSSFTEGLPNVILEAAYFGVPIVATDVGGTSEIIAHGLNGWLVRPRSVRALAAGLRQYLMEPARFQGMARAGRDDVGRRFSIETRTDGQTVLYEQLAGGGP